MPLIDYRLLTESTSQLLHSAGFSEASAQDMATSLVTADMMGHTTHGLALLPWYVSELGAGNVESEGTPTLVSESVAIHRWEGHRLPGAYVVERAIDHALSAGGDAGVLVSTIANTFHNGALVTYLPKIAAAGKMGILVSSGPGAQGVVPHGSTQAVYTPNPISAVIPTTTTPMLIDISSSVTTMNRAKQYAESDRPLPPGSAISSDGAETTSARLLVEGGGALLPLGGMTHGHKGYGLALIVEALTQSLTGRGRQAKQASSTVNTTLILLSPDEFAGYEPFVAASSFLADECRQASPIESDNPVRIPGDRSWDNFCRARQIGVEEPTELIERLRAIATDLELQIPL